MKFKPYMYFVIFAIVIILMFMLKGRTSTMSYYDTMSVPAPTMEITGASHGVVVTPTSANKSSSVPAPTMEITGASQGVVVAPTSANKSVEGGATPDNNKPPACEPRQEEGIEGFNLGM